MPSDPSHINYLLSLGSNIEPREQFISDAMRRLSQIGSLASCSSLYETDPMYILEQAKFLNCVVKLKCALEATELLGHLHQIEFELGRVREVQNGPRTIDIDIILADQQIVNQSNLIIPHPLFHERAFVLVPLGEIENDIRDPRSGKSCSELLQSLPAREIAQVRKIKPMRSNRSCSSTERLFDAGWGSKTYVMGILNVTPDSFSGDGLLVNRSDPVEQAVLQAKEMEVAGADCIDVGGESTRPGSSPISAGEELNRVIPVIQRLGKEMRIPISVDTYKAEVAEAALSAGATIINDVWALDNDRRMLDVIADSQAYVVLMHNQSRSGNVVLDSTLGSRFINLSSPHLLDEIKTYLMQRVELCLANGVKENRIIIDPGFGFGKTVEQNIELLKRLHEISFGSFPILAGLSRKSFLGFHQNLPPNERLETTMAALTIAIQQGVDIVRVHDVKSSKRVTRFCDLMFRVVQDTV